MRRLSRADSTVRRAPLVQHWRSGQRSACAGAVGAEALLKARELYARQLPAHRRGGLFRVERCFRSIITFVGARGASGILCASKATRAELASWATSMVPLSFKATLIAEVRGVALSQQSAGVMPSSLVDGRCRPLREYMRASSRCVRPRRSKRRAVADGGRRLLRALCCTRAVALSSQETTAAVCKRRLPRWRCRRMTQRLCSTATRTPNPALRRGRSTCWHGVVSSSWPRSSARCSRIVQRVVPRTHQRGKRRGSRTQPPRRRTGSACRRSHPLYWPSSGAQSRLPSIRQRSTS
jgi:hypothetical protein